MANYTITYSPGSQGWTSFHSYHPEWMVSMNSHLYTFSEGNLYKHNVNPIRNNYYGTTYESKITTIFNDEPDQTKQFKTIATNSTKSWDTIVSSDQGSGYINDDYYQLKEGTWYAYIRRNANDNSLSMTSAQGIGNVASYTASTLTFSFNIGDILSDGDKLYFISGSAMVFAGTITAHTNNTITINQTGTAPTNGSFILYLKNPEAESTPTRGTYLSVELSRLDESYTEIFMISSEAFKSYS